VTGKDHKWLSHSGTVSARCDLIGRAEKWDRPAISGAKGDSSPSSGGGDWETSAAGPVIPKACLSTRQ